MNSFYKNIGYIRGNVSASALWGQLAEEAAELAQAALKMQRLCTEDNPPHCSADEVHASFIEELADVNLCLRILQPGPLAERDQVMIRKAERWAGHIRARLKNDG